MKKYFLLFLILLIGSFWTPLLAADENEIRAEERIVRGNSLSPLIKPGDKVKIYFDFYDTHKIQREDIVACKYSCCPDPIIKIVRGIPKDKFELKELKDGSAQVLINRKVLKNSSNQPYKFTGKRKKMLLLYEKDYRGIIPERTYLLLGNIVSGSLDSARFGLVDEKEIIAKAESVKKNYQKLVQKEGKQIMDNPASSGN